jgi:hypothetical protein
MKKLFCALCLTLCVTSCAWFKANSSALTTDGLTVIECVVEAALAGNPVELIGCAGLAVTDIIDILSATHTPVVSSPTLTAALATHPKPLLIRALPVTR